jgi:hypothetical protein
MSSTTDYSSVDMCHQDALSLSRLALALLLLSTHLLLGQVLKYWGMPKFKLKAININIKIIISILSLKNLPRNI